MSDTSFVARSTQIVSTWLNKLNDFAWKGRSPIHVTSTGTANAHVITLPATSLYSAYVSGDRFTYKAHAANTGSMTLQVVGASSLSATAVQMGGAALVGGEIQIGDIVEVAYNGTVFQIVGGNPLARFVQSGTGAIASTVSDALKLYVHTSQYSTQGNYETARAALTGTIGVPSLDVASTLKVLGAGPHAIGGATVAANALTIYSGGVTTFQLKSQTDGGAQKLGLGTSPAGNVSGIHIRGGTNSATVGVPPGITLENTEAALNKKIYDIFNNTIGDLEFNTIDDDYTNIQTVIKFFRGDAVTLTGSAFFSGNLYLGSDDLGASPSGATLTAARAAGTNIAGTNLSIHGGAATGNAAAGNVDFYALAPGASGTTLQTTSERFIQFLSGGTNRGRLLLGDAGAATVGAVVMRNLGFRSGGIMGEDSGGTHRSVLNARSDNYLVMYGLAASTGVRLRDSTDANVLVEIGEKAVNEGQVLLYNGNTSQGGLKTISGSNGLELDAVTAGDLRLSVSGGGDIRWGKALVALGGGAAPTLGTIGGSGPATAAQNSWMRVLDSTGAAFWVPAWK